MLSSAKDEPLFLVIKTDAQESPLLFDRSVLTRSSGRDRPILRAERLEQSVNALETSIAHLMVLGHSQHIVPSAVTNGLSE
jgi:hypothetical protein